MTRALRDAPGSVRRLAAALRPSPADDLTAALGRLLSAIEADDADGVSGTAYRNALIRHGENLAKAGGAEAMRAAADAACAARPDRADERREMITAAWSGLEEWNP